MKKKFIIQLSNDIGNQMFMYASALGLSQKMNRELFIDNKTCFKNNHQYALDLFSISAKTSSDLVKFSGKTGYIRMKIHKIIDHFLKEKSFFSEIKNEDKSTYYNDELFNNSYGHNLFVNGHFESEKYFVKISDQIKDEFKFINYSSIKNDPLFADLNNNESVSICVRQNRFSEISGKLTSNEKIKSDIFTKEQISYIEKAIKIMKSKLTNPKFYLWSNDLTNLNNFFPSNKFIHVKNKSKDHDLLLMTQAKHYITIPSTFNWWGAWLGDNNKKIILRPSDINFTKFKINNNDFWPKKWIEVK